MSGRDLHSLFEGMNLEWAESPFDEKPAAVAATTPAVASAASTATVLPSGTHKGSTAQPPSAILAKKRDVVSAPVRMTADADEEAIDDDDDADLPSTAKISGKDLTFNDLYQSLVESKKQEEADAQSRFLSPANSSFRDSDARETADAQASASKVEGKRTGISSYLSAAAPATGLRIPTAQPTPTAAYRLIPTAAAKDGEEEQQHFDANAGIEAIRRAATHGTPARIHVALSRTDKLELFAKRSTTEPNTLLYATRLNDYTSTSAPIPMMKTDLTTGASTSFASWADSQDGVHSPKLLKQAARMIEDMITSAGTYDASKTKIDENN